MRIHILQHVPFEGPGYIADWIQEKGHTLTLTRFYDGDVLPNVEEIDALVILGGPMGIYDDHQYEWLHDEKVFIFDYLETKKPILGICLGSQLIAHILRTPIYKNREPEIGWFPIHFTDEAKNTIFAGLNEPMTVLHWHGDAFDLPYGATLLASSDATKVQAYILDQHILGLLCHFEMRPENIKALLSNSAKDLNLPGSYVQKENQISIQIESACVQTQKALYQILDSFFAQVPLSTQGTG